jgi:hypothetical protein
MRDRVIDAQSNEGGGRGGVLEGRWSRRDLARLRSAADPQIDQIALAPPRWQPDPALIERGQQVFADFGLCQVRKVRRGARHAARSGVRRLSKRGPCRRRS